MNDLGLGVLVLIFAAAAAAVWAAGISLSQTTDILSRRLGWGTAVGGLVALAVVTNLPEIAIVLSGAVRGDLSLAVGNIVGGIAAQTVVLALLDRFGPRGEGPLMYRAASMTLVLEGLLVVIILGIFVGGTQMSPHAIFLRITPAALLIAAVWFVGVQFIARKGPHLPWTTPAPTPAASKKTTPKQHGKKPSRSTRAVALTFAGASLVTLIAGVVLEQSSGVIADRLGMSGAVFGATVLAAATSLPELSTGLTSVRMGDDALAVGDIFGGNAFLPTLFLPAALISGTAILPSAQKTDILLTASGIVLTCVYLVGIVVRPRRRILGMGVDSFLVLVLYLLSVAALFFV